MLTDENLRFAEAHDADRKLIALLRRVAARKRRSDSLKALLARPPLKRLEPAVYRLRDEWWRIRRRTPRS